MIISHWLIFVTLLLALSVPVNAQSAPGCEELKAATLAHLKQRPKVGVVKLYNKVTDLTRELRDYEAQTVESSLRKPDTIRDEWSKLVKARYGRSFEWKVNYRDGGFSEPFGELWAREKKELRADIALREDIIRQSQRGRRLSPMTAEYHTRKIKDARKRLGEATSLLAMMEDYEKDEDVAALRKSLEWHGDDPGKIEHDVMSIYSCEGLPMRGKVTKFSDYVRAPPVLQIETLRFICS